MLIDLTSILNLQRIRPNEAVAIAVHEHQSIVLDLNASQLDDGVNSSNESLGRYSNIKYKGRFEPVDLKKSGYYREQRYVIADYESLTVLDSDPKDVYLQRKYGSQRSGGKDYLGLNDSNQAIAAEQLQPFVVQQLEDQLI